MKRVNQIIKMTNNKFLNMYDFIGVTKSGKDMKYHVSSRAKEIEDLQIKKDGIPTIFLKHKAILFLISIILILMVPLLVLFKRYLYMML